MKINGIECDVQSGWSEDRGWAKVWNEDGELCAYEFGGTPLAARRKAVAAARRRNCAPIDTRPLAEIAAESRKTCPPPNVGMGWYSELPCH